MATTAKRGLNLVQKFRIREFQRVLPTGTTTTTSSSSLTSNPAIPNPFIPHLNPETGRWAPPRYSLRRQAELIKQAKKNGTLYLLPPGPKLKPRGIPSLPESVKTPIEEATKSSEFTQPVDWIGEVKVHEPAGANVGNRLYAAKKQMFKGHKWERVYRRERKYRRILMKHMPKRVRKWRLYYVSRRPWPLSTIRGKKGKSRVLPF